MSLYSELLAQSLDGTTPADGSPTSGDLLARLLLHRLRLPGPLGGRHDGAPGAVARELAYDAALVRLCRHLRLPTDPSLYRLPRAGRAHHEGLLAVHGIRLEELDRYRPDGPGPGPPGDGRSPGGSGGQRPA